MQQAYVLARERERDQGLDFGHYSLESIVATKKTENTPSTSLTALPVPLTRHTDTPGWQPSLVTPDTPSQTV
jgi:hypothetical protein